MLRQLRERLKRLAAERAEKLAEMRELREAVEAEGRADFNPDEQTRWDAARSRIAELDGVEGDDEQRGEIATLEARIAELEDIDRREQQAGDAAARADADGGSDRPARSGVHVGREAHTYRQRGPHSFFADAFRAQRTGDEGARDRLARHQREMDDVYRDYRGTDAEVRAGVAANYSGLVIPQYLVEEFADVARAGKPFLNEIRNVPLPDQGMEVHIGKGTTGTSVAAQATEGGTVSETDYDDTDLNVPVRTYAGKQIVSRQAVERGALVDEILAEDLLKAYYTAVDAGAIASDGTSGTHKGVLSATGINAVTYTDASPTVAELYPKVADAAWNQIPSNIFAGADRIFMHPRRFGWIMGAVDSSGRPIAVPDVQGPNNAMAGGGGGPAYGPTGYRMQGIPIVTDASIPTNLGAGTNEDRVIACVARELIFWEDPDAPIQLRFDETKAETLQVLFVAYGYSAFTAERRPKATSVISGTGLVAPTF